MSIASRSQSSGATCAHANGYQWALLINVDEAHTRRKSLLQCPCLCLPSWPPVLSSHCLLKQQDHAPTFTTEPGNVLLLCIVPLIFHDWCDASRIEGDGRRAGDYFSVALLLSSADLNWAETLPSYVHNQTEVAGYCCCVGGLGRMSHTWHTRISLSTRTN